MNLAFTDGIIDIGNTSSVFDKLLFINFITVSMHFFYVNMILINSMQNLILRWNI